MFERIDTIADKPSSIHFSALLSPKHMMKIDLPWVNAGVAMKQFISIAWLLPSRRQ